VDDYPTTIVPPPITSRRAPRRIRAVLAGGTASSRDLLTHHLSCFTVCAARGHLLLPGAARQLPDKALGLFAANREVGSASVHHPAVTVGSPVTPVCTGQAWRQPDW
jgi:hypothetical protein